MTRPIIFTVPGQCRWRGPDGEVSQQVLGVLVYRTDDPLAVAFSIGYSTGGPVWLLAVDLLSAGLTAPAGDGAGDVQVRPLPGDIVEICATERPLRQSGDRVEPGQPYRWRLLFPRSLLAPVVEGIQAAMPAAAVLKKAVAAELDALSRSVQKGH